MFVADDNVKRVSFLQLTVGLLLVKIVGEWEEVGIVVTLSCTVKC